MGYPPTYGELRAYLGSVPPRGQRRHRLTLLASSIDILQEMARLAKTTRRRVPRRCPPSRLAKPPRRGPPPTVGLDHHSVVRSVSRYGTSASSSSSPSSIPEASTSRSGVDSESALMPSTTNPL
jgi:hypothetical protein